MRLAVVDVEVQRALTREQPAAFSQARDQEREIVVKRVAVGGLGQQARAVAATLKPRPVAVRVGHRAQRLARLRPAGVERRIDVDQLKRLVGELREQVEVVAEQDLVCVGVASERLHVLGRLPSERFPGQPEGAPLGVLADRPLLP